MIQGHRVVLKCGVQIGLGNVPGIPGLGKQAKIRDPQVPHQRLPDRQPGFIGIVRQLRMNSEKKHHRRKAYSDKQEEKIGFPHMGRVNRVF